MMSYAKNLDFEKAARVREELMALRNKLSVLRLQPELLTIESMNFQQASVG